MSRLLNSAVFSIIKDEYQGRSISDAFLYLVKVVIKTKAYNTFKIQDLCADFQDICGFHIPYHPMTVIINQLKTQGYVCDSKAGGFIPIKARFDESVSTDAIEKEQAALSSLLNRFIQFANTQGQDFSISEAEKTLNDFIELNGLELFRGSLDYSPITDNEQIRLFYLFYATLVDSDVKAVEYISSLIVGRILTDLFISGQDKGAGNSKSNATVYFDTSVVFPLLGIDTINRVDVYKQLLLATQGLGMRVKVFYHTYVEMLTLIEGSRTWIGNPDYNPLEATASTRFFVSHNYSREDVADFASNLEQLLNRLGIEVDRMPYPNVWPRGVQTEQFYYDLIVAKYKATSRNFDEELKQSTVDKDARSLFYVDYLNAGIRAPQMQSISSIFVTSNNSLAAVSKTRVVPNSTEIPDCVNDVYWGTLIWLNNPQQLLASAKLRVAANAYAAFLPSTVLMKKLIESAARLQENDDISPEEAYFLKTSSLAQKMLMELTKGDDKCFSEKTPLDILYKIRDEAKLQGQSEERSIAQAEIAALNEQMKKMRDSFEEQNARRDREFEVVLRKLAESERKNQERDIKEYKKKKEDIQDYLRSQESLKQKAEKRLRHEKNLLCGVLFLISGCCIYGGIRLFQIGTSKGYDYLAIISFIISIVFCIFPIIIHIVSGKPLDTNKLISKVIQKRLFSLYRKNEYDENECIAKAEELKVIEEKLLDLENQETVCSV